MADIPTVAPLPQMGQIQPLGVGAGLSKGLESGIGMGYTAAQTAALQLQNKFLPATLALKQQEIKMQMEKQAAEIKKQKIDSALGFLGQVGEKVKFFTPESQKIAIANGMNAIADAAPEWGIKKTDPSQIPDEGVDLIKQYGQLYKARMEGSISEGEFQSDGNQILTKMTQYQREMMKENQSVLGQPSFEPGQMGNAPGAPAASFNTKTGMPTNPQGQPIPGGNFVPSATAASTAAENVRGAAAATAPLVGASYSVNLAKHALTKGDELNDHIAINEFGKLINNGAPVPLPELQKMVKAGTWGPKFAQAFAKFTGEGALSEEQRTMMQSALDTLGESLQQQSGTKTAQFPGATPPKLPAVSAYKIGQTVNFKQGAYKKIKDGPDADPSTWERKK